MTKITVTIQSDGKLSLQLLLTILGIELSVLGVFVTIAVARSLL